MKAFVRNLRGIAVACLIMQLLPRPVREDMRWNPFRR